MIRASHPSQYCSRDCQLAHWAAHRGDCKHLLLKDSWSPSWIKQGRPPSFFGGDTAVESFGGDQYFWGNIPAIDCLQLEHNEGIARSVTRDFNLCFAGKNQWQWLTLSSLFVCSHFDIQPLATSETLFRLSTDFLKATRELYQSCSMTRAP